jgi:2',3'-cyclic-nucleotide 2'-phosphodiesterase (5'-nucleotidase family)
MKVWKALVALSLLVLTLGACASGTPPPQVHEFTILHFNDFHGQVEPLSVPPGQPAGGMARLAGQANVVRAENHKHGEPTLLLFAGDLFTGTAFSTLFQGLPEFNALKQMRLTAATTGNHEWDFGQGVLLSRVRHAGVPMVLANVSAADPEHVFWKPFLELEVGGLRIGVVGVVTPDTPVTTAPGNTQGYLFGDPAEAVGRVLAERGKEWDFVVLLSHCGFEVDREIARRYPQLGLIVGGHDHKVLEQPYVESGVPIVQAGDRGRFLGEVRVKIARGQRATVTGHLVPITSATPEDPEVTALLAEPLAKEKAALGEVVGKLPVALTGDRTVLRSGEALLGDLITDAMRSVTQADIALLNAGTIRAGLPAGPVTGRDLLACLPFFDSVCTLRLTGAQVQSLLNRCAAMPVEDAPGGFLQVSGLTVRYQGGRAFDVTVGGEPLAPDREYLVACSHFLLSGGDGLVEFKEGKDVRDFGVALQELLRRELARPDLTLPEAGKRILRSTATAEDKAA